MALSCLAATAASTPAENRIDNVDDAPQAFAAGASGQLSNPILESHKALGSWPFVPFPKGVPEEIKSPDEIPLHLVEDVLAPTKLEVSRGGGPNKVSRSVMGNRTFASTTTTKGAAIVRIALFLLGVVAPEVLAHPR